MSLACPPDISLGLPNTTGSGRRVKARRIDSVKVPRPSSVGPNLTTRYAGTAARNLTRQVLYTFGL